MAPRVRKSAASLNDAETAAFMEAVVRIKNKPAADGSGLSVYDQLVALHGAVMGVFTPASGQSTVNFGHGNIGFLPWHRQYLLDFEDALRAEVPGATLPYWDWADDLGAVNELFTPSFLSSRRWGNPAAVSDGVLRPAVPAAERPAWWPGQAAGFAVDGLLTEGMGTHLTRGSMEQSWPPSAQWMTALVEADITRPGMHALWMFWLILEQGSPQLPQTHNAGHRFIGGHMGGSFSPNDPIFWLHHANVDRLWDAWQRRRLALGTSADPAATWPDPAETSPFDGRLAPEGHKIDDAMWPWLGGAAGYDSSAVSNEVRARLPTINRRALVRNMLDNDALEVSYV
jgi:tyrosinase